MKFIKKFNEWNQVSEELKYHIDHGLELTDFISYTKLGNSLGYSLAKCSTNPSAILLNPGINLKSNSCQLNWA